MDMDDVKIGIGIGISTCTCTCIVMHMGNGTCESGAEELPYPSRAFPHPEHGIFNQSSSPARRLPLWYWLQLPRTHDGSLFKLEF
jgi:hypothetical protein